jgi:hypothetical protein
MKKISIFLMSVLAAGILAGCGERPVDPMSGAPEDTSDKPVISGGNAPGQIDPGTGQPSAPGAVGLPGGKGGG